jgi:predicted Zn-dependent peptidase
MNNYQKILNLKNPTELSGFYLVYKGSVLNEKVGIRGISHLMEHLCCKNFDHLLEEFDQNGIDWNAYTADDVVVFYFQGLEEKLSKYRDVVVDLMSKFNVTEEQFKNEKQIVIEEYENSFNEQTECHSENLFRKLFNTYGPIGELGDLKKLTYQDCLDYFEIQYKNPTMIINVSKDFKYEKVLNFSKPTEKLNKIYRYLKDNDYTLQKSNEFKDKTSIIYLSNVVTNDFVSVSFITDMLGLGLKSPLYIELREKRGLVYYVHCYLDKKSDASGFINISSLTSNNNVNLFKETLDNLLNKPETFLTKERFDLIKDMYLTKFKKREINRYRNVSDFISPNEWNLEYNIESITLEDLKEVYKKYFTNWYKSTDKDEFNK